MTTSPIDRHIHSVTEKSKPLSVSYIIKINGKFPFEDNNEYEKNVALIVFEDLSEIYEMTDDESLVEVFERVVWSHGHEELFLIKDNK